MTYPGFVGAENLRSQKDPAVIAMFQTWEQLGNWQAWEISGVRQSLLEEAKPLLIEPPKVTVYTLMPTVWSES